MLTQVHCATLKAAYITISLVLVHLFSPSLWLSLPFSVSPLQPFSSPCPPHPCLPLPAIVWLPSPFSTSPLHSFISLCPCPAFLSLPCISSLSPWALLTLPALVTLLHISSPLLGGSAIAYIVLYIQIIIHYTHHCNINIIYGADMGNLQIY